MQQYLPLAVLKQQPRNIRDAFSNLVATVLTACGIETYLGQLDLSCILFVATVLTVYGIETNFNLCHCHVVLRCCCNSTYRLRYWNAAIINNQDARTFKLQQYLPFTVLKLSISTSSKSSFNRCNSTYRLRYWNFAVLELPNTRPFCVATVLTVYGIETNL